MKKSMVICLCTLFLLINFFSCGAPDVRKRGIEHTLVQASENVPLPEDFIDFYIEFHKDSLFQMEHIIFPMKGEPISKENYSIEELESFRWTPENWEFHKKNPTLNENYTTDFEMMGETMIIEHVFHNTGMFGMERRFSKSGDTWNLIFYKGMNSLGDWTPK